LEEIVASVRNAISEWHGIDLYKVVIVKPGGLPKTSSGKLQRGECRKAYLDGTLRIIMEHPGQPTNVVQSTEVKGSTHRKIFEVKSRSVTDTARLVRGCIASAIGINPENVTDDTPFSVYGLSSLHVIRICAELQNIFARRVSPGLIYEHSTVQSLSTFLSTHSAEIHTEDFGVSSLPNEPIAIIGMACRFPGADNLARFWDLLMNGAESIGLVPSDRWDWKEFYSPGIIKPNQMSTCYGGFLKEIDHFDSLFFGLSAQEAIHMDPQQRLLLEVAWEALEDAGENIKQLAGSAVGVFVGLSSFDYAEILRRQHEISPFAGPGGALSIAANRLSYTFDLQGPSIVVDTGAVLCNRW